MVKNNFRLFLTIIVSMFFVGCGSYSKIIKNPDKDYVYDEAINYFEDGKYMKASNLLTSISPYFINTIKEDSVNYYQGAANYKMGNFGTSSEIFEDFRRRFGRSPFIEDVEYMYAKGYYFSSPKVERDQTMTRQAIIVLNEYLDRYPESAKKETILENIEELQDRLYEKSFLSAYSYYKTQKYKSAIVALRNSLNEYPDTKNREEMMYLIIKSAYLLAKDSYEHLQRDRFLNIMDFYYNFIAEFPQSKYLKELNRYEKATQDFLAKFDITEIKENNTEDGN